MSNAAEVEVTRGCDTLNVSYIVNSLPGDSNEATLRSLVVRYRAILGRGSGTRNVSLNGRAAAGVVSFSGLARGTAYRITYSVDVDVSFPVTLPSDIPDPIQVFTTRTCIGQCSTTAVLHSYGLFYCCMNTVQEFPVHGIYNRGFEVQSS